MPTVKDIIVSKTQQESESCENWPVMELPALDLRLGLHRKGNVLDSRGQS